MPGKHLFEYAVIRIVPHVEREEFLNAGIVLFCAKEKFLHVIFEVNEAKISAFCNKLDIAEMINYLTVFERICAGGAEAGPIGKLTTAERFRWLTATRSTIVQTSKVHAGFCTDPKDKLIQLFNQMVL